MAQLSAEQRYEIASLKGLGLGPSGIMDRTGIDKSVVSRELKRNSKSGVYDAARAHKMSAARRQRGVAKIKGSLKDQVDKLLGRQYSPEQISGRLRLEGYPCASHECLYQYIYRERKEGGVLYKNLRFSHKKRRKRLSKKDKRGMIPNKRMIGERPQEVANKSRLGDWEGDTIIGKGHQGAAVTLVERVSKFTIIQQVAGKTAIEVEEAVVKMIKNCPIQSKTITFDNGTEFTNHQQMSERLGVEIYFANPYHSWERGLNENTNGLIRQYVSKDQNIKELCNHDFEIVQEKLNNRPRKSLGFLTPIEFLSMAYETNPAVAFET